MRAITPLEIFAAQERPGLEISPNLLQALAKAPPLSTTGRMLLAGPPRCGKTSFLFHYAYSLAQEGKHVLVLCAKSSIEQSLPLLPVGVEPGSNIWAKVHMKYVDSVDDIRKFAACFHLSKCEAPSAVLVDEIMVLSRRTTAGERHGFEMRLMHALGSVEEIARGTRNMCHRISASRSGEACTVVVSAESWKDGPHHLYLLNRWLRDIVLIRRGKEGCFVVGKVSNNSLSPGHCCLSYSIGGNEGIRIESMALPGPAAHSMFVGD